MSVSIIIPVYNKEMYLNDCIQSVVNQQYRDIEIIIINDGSKDNSENIIEKWSAKDKRIRYFSQRNQGVAIARNKGISIANGDYIFFLDADDYLEEYAILKLVTDALYSKADIIIGNFYEKSGNKFVEKQSFENKLFNKSDLKKTGTTLEMFIVNNRHMARAGNKLYKLDFLKKLQVSFVDGVIAEDRLFNLICYVNNPTIQVVNEYTYIYNILDNSRSRTLSSNYYDQNISLLNYLYDYLKKESKLEEYQELFQLIVMYDVSKVINQTFERSKEKIKSTNVSIKKLRENTLIFNTISAVIKEEKFKKINGGKAFYRISLLNYLLVKAPFLVPVYKTVAYISRKVKLR
ncbi:glycosyltransferase family 2 protein [Oceanobacillus indicireducens]|uniref:glycosyltransferase family 2 protein n=1 Tax=Oceanobacillus indicireducens TaxID=1004261 RepID=UPI001668AFD7|nr:glycosyltransferase [Oceanobacillus indicireducens]